MTIWQRIKAVRKIPHYDDKRHGMFGNYLKVALRNIGRHKGYTAINIMGLAIGMACCLLIALYVQHETSFDAFHENGDKLYRLVLQEEGAGGEVKRNTLFPESLVADIVAETPGVERATGVIGSWGWFAWEDQTFEERLYLVHPSFLSMFSFPLLAGTSETALAREDGMVISRRLARKLTGSHDEFIRILGQAVEHNNKDFVVTGIARDLPVTSSMQFDALVSIENQHLGYFKDTDWSGASTIFVQLRPDLPPEQMEATLWSAAQKNMGGRIREHLVTLGYSDDALSDIFSIGLQPLHDIYLNSEITSHYTANGDAFYTRVLASIAVLVLLIACVNFALLSIGRATGRAQEVGVRKVLGAQRGDLARQFWGETFVLCTIALILGVGLAEAFLPIFNDLTSRDLHISYFSLGLLFSLMGVWGVTGLLAGSYPVAVLSSIQPRVLFKSQEFKLGNNLFGKILLVGQYALVAFLLVCFGTVLRQLDFMSKKDLGFEKEFVVVVPVPGEEVGQRYKEILAQRGEVIGSAGSDRSFTSGSQSREVQLENGAKLGVRIIRVDVDYLQTLGLKLSEGRDFDATRVADVAQSVIVNETLVRSMGWEEPLGKFLEGIAPDGSSPPVVIGVVEDFHFDSLHSVVQPLALSMNPAYHGIYHTFVRLQPGAPSPSLAILADSWATLNTGLPFTYTFLDENLSAQYRAEEDWSRIVACAVLFAVAIACMGLVGLAALAMGGRTKEIGIRKALGASATSLVVLVYRDFTWLVLVANGLAWPVAYWAMDDWLANFAYRVEMGAEGFIAGGILTLALVWGTISYQSFKAVTADPIQTLKFE